MQTTLTQQRWPLRAWLCGLACVVLLTACGGGGGGSSTSSGSGGGAASTGVVNLTGVVATGAPMISARVAAVDVRGVAQGSTLAFQDGHYDLTLSTTSAQFPLLVQATGFDMQGNPVVLHSVLQAPNATSSANVVNVTPFTNAVVGMLLGGDPRPYFSAAVNAPGTDQSATWALLKSSAALTAAKSYLLKIVTANLSAAPPTPLSQATLNIFSDANFTANHLGMDAVLDAVRIQFVPNIDGPQLKLSNKLALAGTTEVTVKLAQAKSDLQLPTPTVTAAATTGSSATGTSSAVANTHVNDLVALQSAINTELSLYDAAFHPAFDPTQWTTHQFGSLSTYSYLNGATFDDLLNQFTSYAIAKLQLSPFQVVGCLDDPVPSGGCTKVKVASLLQDVGNGNRVVGVFENVLRWAAASAANNGVSPPIPAKPAGWIFVGNASPATVNLYPVTWQQWTSSGAVSGSPGQGLQAIMSSITTLLGTTSFGLANHTALQVYPPSSGVGNIYFSSTPTGDLLADEVLAVTQSGPLSASDVSAGARYVFTSTSFLTFPDPATGTPSTQLNWPYYVRLTADLPTSTAASQYPLPDDLTTTPLSVVDFYNGRSISWSAWAATNPHLRMVEMRAVINSPSASPMTTSVSLPPMSSNQAMLAAFTGVPPDANQFTLWLIAQDEQGRRYISKIVAGS